MQITFYLLTVYINLTHQYESHSSLFRTLFYVKYQIKKNFAKVTKQISRRVNYGLEKFMGRK